MTRLLDLNFWWSDFKTLIFFTTTWSAPYSYITAGFLCLSYFPFLFHFRPSTHPASLLLDGVLCLSCQPPTPRTHRLREGGKQAGQTGPPAHHLPTALLEPGPRQPPVTATASFWRLLSTPLGLISLDFICIIILLFNLTSSSGIPSFHIKHLFLLWNPCLWSCLWSLFCPIHLDIYY